MSMPYSSFNHPGGSKELPAYITVDPPTVMALSMITPSLEREKMAILSKILSMEKRLPSQRFQDPFSSITTSLPRRASSLATVPPPAPVPTTTTSACFFFPCT